MATPPSLTKSLGLRSPALPVPTTTRRPTSSPAGARISRADPFLPLNCSASAALVTRSPLAARSRRPLDLKLSPSSQNTTRTPLAGLENGTNSSLRAPAMVIRSSLTVPVGSIGGMSQGKPCLRREGMTKLRFEWPRLVQKCQAFPWIAAKTGGGHREAECAVLCALSKGLPWRGHDVGG